MLYCYRWHAGGQSSPGHLVQNYTGAVHHSDSYPQPELEEKKVKESVNSDSVSGFTPMMMPAVESYWHECDASVYTSLDFHSWICQDC